MNNIESFKIFRELKCNSKLSQREISKKCSISLGKTNMLIKELINKEFLIKNETNYLLTQTAIDLLDNYRVDNAIILAAGFGSRFVPLTYEMPKGLLEVYGERMIERQIKQLIEADITDITIVVGYLKEKFEYLIDKYGVKLVYSPDFMTKNNLSSLYHVRDLLKNTYILCSDNYLIENIFNSYEYRSWYCSTKVDGDTAEWCFETDKKNMIKKVEIGGYNAWQMYGPAYFTESFSNTIVPLIEKTYNQKGSNNYYWEHVLMRNLSKLEMYANKQPSDTIYEFENLEELREFDETYKEKSNNIILNKITNIFNINEDEIHSIKPLKLGMTNKSFLFEVKNKKYICRIPGEGSEQLVDRVAEYNSFQAIIPLNITEDIVYINPEDGIKISIYEENIRSVDTDNSDELKKCMSILKYVHNSELNVEHTFSFKKNIDFYENLCKPLNAILYENYSQVRINMNELMSILNKIHVPTTLCHIDANSDNFLVLTDGNMKLIDWEYAAMHDPLVDVSMFAIYSYFDENQIEKLMNYYLERNPTYEERLRVYIYIALGGFLWALWAEYKQALGVAFGEYTLKMYRYAIAYYKKVTDLIDESKINY
ncbi:phosphotransferase [Clostridium sediminicola]|uniref:sugar phosphate nucleotidyltransferase n=1 Tax=Clostridium sediminicola TaxID=3114879 RepID=UPI0031F1D602